MNYTENDILLFDQFLENNLSKEQKIDFLNRLETEPDFKNDFDSYQLDIDVLNKAQDRIILDEIQKTETHYFKNKFKKKVLFILFPLLLIIVLTFPRFHKDPIQKPQMIDSLNHKNHLDTTTHTTIEEEVEEEVEEEFINEGTETPSILDTHSLPPSKNDSKEIKKVYYSILPFENTSIFNSGDTIIINSQNKIQSIIPFTKGKDDFLLLDRSLYKLEEEKYIYTTDNRPADLIQRSTGKGKNHVIVINYYYIKASDTIDFKVMDFDNSLFIFKKDTLEYPTLLNNKDYAPVTKNIKSSYFTPLDLMELQGN